jgi:hypothetical protein
MLRRSLWPVVLIVALAGCSPGLTPQAGAPASVNPPHVDHPPHFSILDWRVIPATDVSKPKLIGELRNDGDTPMGPHLQVTVRGPDRRVSAVVDFWPASVSDLDPGQTFAFSHFLDSGPDDSIELKVIGGRTWKH